jgi:hypothetical protein
MVTRSRRTLVIVLFGAMVVACGPSSSGVSSPATATAPATGPATETPSPSTPSTSAALTGQTDTEWGRIWDTVPSGFPVFPGATPADDAGGEPVSARLAVEGGDPEAIAIWLQDALEQATFSTLGLNGPGEDGGFVIDSAGEGDCRIQTSIVPLGGETFVSIRYGADCPAP